MNDLKLSELLDEIEFRLRRIIREEIKAAFIESDNPNVKIEYSKISKSKEHNSVNNFPTILTAPEVAELIGIKVQRLYELVRTRKTSKIPVIVIGERQYRFSKEAVLAWLQRDNSAL